MTLPVTLRAQILKALSSGQSLSTAALLCTVSGHPTSIKNELTRLVKAGVVKRVRHGVYQILTAEVTSDTLTVTSKITSFCDNCVKSL